MSLDARLRRLERSLSGSADGHRQPLRCCQHCSASPAHLEPSPSVIPAPEVLAGLVADELVAMHRLDLDRSGREWWTCRRCLRESDFPLSRGDNQSEDARLAAMSDEELVAEHARVLGLDGDLLAPIFPEHE